MELSSEDALRLNVLLANRPLAIRINESRMTVEGLLASGEVTIQLRPDRDDDKYLREVRALLSEHALGNSGGYPLYLQRWTRMGQMRDESLEQLLLLGEPTAVFAVVCAGGLTDELARRAWWAQEEAENARRMLLTAEVASGSTGPVLARYLIDYLPFESETEAMIESIRVALQPGLLGGEEIAALWRKARRKPTYLVGFLAAIPDALPGEAQPRIVEGGEQLAALAEAGDPWARSLCRLFSAPGQVFLETVQQVLDKPATLDVVTHLFDAVRGYLAAVRPEGDPDLGFEALVDEARHHLAGDCSLEAWPAALRDARWGELVAIRLLSGVGFGAIRPLLRDSTVIGSLLRRKLQPLLEPLSAQISLLRGGQRG